jgi:phytoene/squalene synthetase
MFLPQRLLAHLNLKPEGLFAGGGAHVIQQARLAMLDRARFAFQQARDLARVMPAAAFPAIGYVALEPLYRAQLLAGQEKAPISLLRRQMKLLAASALGRF